MPDPERPPIERVVDLQRLVSKFAEVKRSNTLENTAHVENDAEHSFGLAITAWFLAARFAPHLQLDKILRYSLVHDLVEVYAGDVPGFSEPEKHAMKELREQEAHLQLKDEWPDFPEMTDDIETCLTLADEEAVFVYGVDKLLPTIMINLGEKDQYWHRRQISEEMLRGLLKPKFEQSPLIAPYFEELFKWATNPDYFYHPEQPV